MPPIWRRLLVPGDYTLSDLHEIIQEAMGWRGGHLHQFVVGKDRYSDPSSGSDDNDEAMCALDELGLETGSKFLFKYDFGDSWMHSIKVKETSDQKLKYPVCLAGKRPCPPEDCGGIYRECSSLLEVLKDPKQPAI